MGSLAPGSGKGPPAPVVFRLYRMRFAGTAALVTLNIVSALNTFCFTASTCSSASTACLALLTLLPHSRALYSDTLQRVLYPR